MSEMYNPEVLCTLSNTVAFPCTLYLTCYLYQILKLLMYLFVYLPPTEDSFPFTEDFHNVIQNVHALRRKEKKKGK